MGFYIIKKKKKNVQIFNAKYYCSLLCLSKNEKISRLGGKSDEFVKKRSCQNMCYCVNEL